MNEEEARELAFEIDWDVEVPFSVLDVYPDGDGYCYVRVCMMVSPWNEVELASKSQWRVLRREWAKSEGRI